jgi:hypothetical protein
MGILKPEADQPPVKSRREVRVEDERRDAARLLYHLGFLKNTVPDIAHTCSG